MIKIKELNPDLLRAFIMLAAMMTLLMAIGYTSGQNDFILFYTASRQFISHLNPYDATIYPLGYQCGFAYPPLAFLLSLPFAFFKASVAVTLWDIACLLSLMATLYFWVDLLFVEKPDFRQFSLLAIAAISAPCLWAFYYHHMILPVLLFASLATWLQVRKKSSFWSGVACALMWIKPHILFLLGITLFFKSGRKKSFAAGLLLLSALQFLPFISGYRPLKDLRGWTSSAKRLGSSLYSPDEQSLVSIVFKQLQVKPHHEQFLAVDGIHGRLLDPNRLRFFKQLNTATFFLGTIIAGILLLSISFNENPAYPYAFAIALGLLISPYSHSYDAVLMLPLLLCALQRYQATETLHILCGILFFVNVSLSLGLIMGTPSQPWWNHMAWCATIYSGLCLTILGVLKFQKYIQEVCHEAREQEVTEGPGNDRIYRHLGDRGRIGSTTH